MTHLHLSALRTAGSVTILLTLASAVAAEAPTSRPSTLPRQLKNCPYRLVYETYRDNNFEIFLMNADGSNPVNLTRTPGVDEYYPHASPDGKRVCFVADEANGGRKQRNIYYMNIDGTGRTRVAENANQPCWSPDGTVIAYLGGVPFPLAGDQCANKGFFFYDLKTGKRTEHVNKDIRRLLCICWSPDSKWFAASAVGGLGYDHSVIALEANGPRHVLWFSGHGNDWQCRPDISPDGKRLLYARAAGEGPTKLSGIDVADLDFASTTPRVSNSRWLVNAPDPLEVCHGDWSPDGRFVACSRGLKELSKMKPGAYIVGVRAKGWDIWVANAAGTNDWLQITHDGLSNKEPDWVFRE